MTLLMFQIKNILSTIVLRAMFRLPAADRIRDTNWKHKDQKLTSNAVFPSSTA